MAFDQATRERRCISECTCAMQTVSWPPTYLATCITLPLAVRGPTEKFFGGCDTICQRASQERDASLHERRVLSQRYDSAMGDRKFCEQSLRALPCTAQVSTSPDSSELPENQRLRPSQMILNSNNKSSVVARAAMLPSGLHKARRQVAVAVRANRQIVLGVALGQHRTRRHTQWPHIDI